MSDKFRLICPYCKAEMENSNHYKFYRHLRVKHLTKALIDRASEILCQEMDDWKYDKQDYKELVRECLKTKL